MPSGHVPSNLSSIVEATRDLAAATRSYLRSEKRPKSVARRKPNAAIPAGRRYLESRNRLRTEIQRAAAIAHAVKASPVELIQTICGALGSGATGPESNADLEKEIKAEISCWVLGSYHNARQRSRFAAG